jgi:hypothetical protein
MHNRAMEIIEDQSEVHALLQRKVQAWNTRNFAGLRELWDTSREPVYVAEEALTPCLSWPDLDAYWSATERGSRSIRIALSDIVLRPLSCELIAAIYSMHWDFLATNAAKPVGGDVRVYAIFRRTSLGWRFAQYIEAPLAPIVYMRELYERQVTAGFVATTP